MAAPIRAIIGLGNPGAEYLRQRHNVGFWLVDALAQQAGENFREQPKLKGWTAQIALAGQPLWLLKPATFMNRSGESVLALLSFYKLPIEQTLVVHDELDLPPGCMRFKRGGGHGGHNGLRDITRVLGAEYARLRVGIGHPGDKSRVTGYVLSAPPADEEIAINAGLDRGITALERLMKSGWEKATQQLHTSGQAKAPDEGKL